MVCGANTAQADVVGSMEGFYNKSKNYTSSTNPGAYTSQTQHAFTGGSYVWRAPQETVTLTNIQMPSISAGCGGIDLFAGSFSFVNGEQLEQLLRAIIQDAAGYAFMLALEEISPIISGNVKSIQDMINEVNAQNINSCEAATAIVDNAIDAYNGKISTTCAVQGAANSIFADAFAGKTCGNENPGEVAGKAQKEDDKLQLPFNTNYAMKSTENTSISGDMDLREFYMSLTGTLVVKVANENPDYLYIPPIALDESVVRALMSGGTIEGHGCAAVTIGEQTYTESDCIQVEQGTRAITIPPSDGFQVRVQNTLASIYDKVAGYDSSAITAEEKAFIADTPMPILKAAEVYSLEDETLGKTTLLSYSEIISYQMALKFLENSSREVLKGSQNNPGANHNDLIQWKTAVNGNIAELGRMQSKLQLRFANVQAFIDDLHRRESRQFGRIHSSLKRSIVSFNEGQ